MTASSTALRAGVAAVALVGSVAAAMAQSSATERQRLIEVPPGATVIVLPAGVAPMAGAPIAAGFPFVEIPSPESMIRQIDHLMAELQDSVPAPARFGAASPTGFPGMALPQGPVSGVVVTSYSDGHGTCTQRVTYSGNGSAPVVHVSSIGNACSSLNGPVPTTSVPAADPNNMAPARGAPHLIQVRDNRRPVAPLVYAQAGG
jgi:hypothetical protein